MSKWETPMIDRWWADCGLSGVLAEGWPLVAKSGRTEARWADAMVVLDSSGTQSKVHWRDLPPIEARDVVVVQAKASPICAPLAGQAIGSGWFTERHGPQSVRSVLLCAADDLVLRPRVDGYGVETIVMPEFAKGSFSLAADHDRLKAWSDHVGGTLWANVDFAARPPALRAHAIHVDDPEAAPEPPASLAGLDVTVVTAQKSQSKGGTSFGMYAFGMAVLYGDLAIRRGAAAVRSVVLTETTDPTIADLCAAFGVDIEEIPPRVVRP